MAEMTLTKTRIQAGVYEGVLQADGTKTPNIGAFFQEAPIAELDIVPDPDQAGRWNVRLALPADVMTDGIQTFLIVENESGETLDSFTVITGEPLDEDIRGEIDLLRAELDMLKKAFRRHCVETA